LKQAGFFLPTPAHRLKHFNRIDPDNFRDTVIDKLLRLAMIGRAREGDMQSLGRLAGGLPSQMEERIL
jgi:hypothetical protein